MHYSLLKLKVRIWGRQGSVGLMQNAVSSYRKSNNPETTNINNGAPISMNGHNMPNIRIQQKF
jgi:hypothetical protein